MIRMPYCMIPLLVVAIGAGPEGVAVKDVVQGNNRFAVDLFGKTKGRPGNLFFSPYSISTALAMTYAGAGGETARQMAATLRFPVDGEALHASFAKLDAGIDGGNETRPYQLSTANALWGQQGLAYRPDFLKLTESDYRAGLHPVDFASDPEAARRLINAWVEERTHDKIKDLIPSFAIRKDTDLVLTNAIYFKGAWASPFQKMATKDEEFTTDQGKVLVPTMHQQAQFGYLDGAEEDFQALDLPYAGGSLSMVVLLPRKADGLAAFEASLTASKLEGWLAKLSRQKVEVALPRFKLECGLDLAGTLKSLGMTLAFGREADFSGMTTDRRLSISAVIHKAFADVNEEGTEAAAATAVVMVTRAMMPSPKPPLVFKADHPFLFLIRDVPSGSILFLGRVANPKG
jgi:serine protease inhibitor